MHTTQLKEEYLSAFGKRRFDRHVAGQILTKSHFVSFIMPRKPTNTFFILQTDKSNVNTLWRRKTPQYVGRRWSSENAEGCGESKGPLRVPDARLCQLRRGAACVFPASSLSAHPSHTQNIVTGLIRLINRTSSTEQLPQAAVSKTKTYMNLCNK